MELDMSKMNALAHQQQQNEETQTMSDDNNELTVMNEMPTADDGFADAASDAQERVIRGQLLKFADGRWKVGNEGIPVDDGMQLIVLSVAQAWVRLRKGEKPQYVWRQPGGKLPSRETLSDRDEREWEPGLDGRAQDPWRDTRFVWFTTHNGALFTFTNASWRGRTGVVELADQIQNMRHAQPNARAVVELDSTPRKDRFGIKPGPVFHIVDWALANNGGQHLASQESAKPVRQIEPPKKTTQPEEPPTPSPEDYQRGNLNDSIPF
jgi:hypothetical protein